MNINTQITIVVTMEPVISTKTYYSLLSDFSVIHTLTAYLLLWYNFPDDDL